MIRAATVRERVAYLMSLLHQETKARHGLEIANEGWRNTVLSATRSLTVAALIRHDPQPSLVSNAAQALSRVTIS